MIKVLKHGTLGSNPMTKRHSHMSMLFTLITALGIGLLMLICAPGCKKQETAPDPIEATAKKADELRKTIGSFKRIANIPIRTGQLSGALALSPDEKHFAVGGSDGSVLIVPLAGGASRSLIGHKESVYEVVFSPDGQSLLTGGADNHLIVWDLKSGTIRHDIAAHNGDIKALAVSSDGTLAATGSVDDNVCVWRLSDGKRQQLLKGHTSSVYDVSFSPNGQYLYSAGRDSTVRRWSLEKGGEKGSPLTMPNTNVKLNWSPDGRQLIVTGLHGQLIRIDPSEWRISHRQRVSHNRVLAMDIAKDGRVAIGERGGRISIWAADIQSKKPLLIVDGAHNGRVQALVFLENDEQLLSLGEDGQVHCWNTKNGQIASVIGKLPPINGLVRTGAIHPQSESIAIASAGKLFFLNTADKDNEPKEMNPGDGGVISITFTPDGTRLLAGTSTGLIRVIKLKPTPSVETQHSVHSGAIRQLIYSGDKASLWTASDDISINQLDAKTFKIKQTITDHGSAIVALAVDPSGRRIASTEEEHITYIRYIKSNTIQWTLRGHNVSHLTFSPDGELLATVQGRRKVVIYQTEIQKKLKDLRGNTTRIQAIAFHPNGRAILTLDKHGSLRAWSIQDGTLLSSANAGRGVPTTLDVAANGDLVLTGGIDPQGSAKLFSLGH
ncbi:MAG TPA: WD40 repeat domain-containing protein [Myxococcales bacterium]|nr:WD40 repeat domain-containing protein [Myxococcales bacterium]